MNRSTGNSRRNVHRRLAIGLLVSTASLTAWAHHGWNWAQEQQTTLQGTIESVSMSPPHPRLQVKSADGRQWQIDLGNPSQTERSGFTGDSAKAGDGIIVLGNRHKDAGQLQMKAVRITIDGRNYDLYPERLPGG